MKVYRKDGQEYLTIKDYKQVGNFMEVATIDATVKSPYPISFQIGDYVIFDYNGLKYTLYNIPPVKKQARSGSYGEAFTYDVKFKADTEQLAQCPFLDIVPNDNNLHFTSLPSFSTYENVYGIVGRIQANMDYLYPEQWVIKVAETEDAELQEILSDAREYSISGSNCLDGCKQIYDTWGVSYIHTFEDGKNVITFGKSAGVTSLFRYGKGQGLRAIKKNVQNADELCTRLYAYGSTRNIPARWYNDKGYIGEAQYIPNLMLPPSKWKDGKPQGAYIDAIFGEDNRIEKYGLRIKTFYYDGSDGREEIYPSIEKLTAKNIRDVKAGLNDTEYVPSVALYPDNERMDFVLEGSNIGDSGIVSNPNYKLWSDKIEVPSETFKEKYNHSQVPYDDGSYYLYDTTKTLRLARFNITQSAKYRFEEIKSFLKLTRRDSASTVTVEYYCVNPLGQRLQLYTDTMEALEYEETFNFEQRYFQADVLGQYELMVSISIQWPEDKKNIRPLPANDTIPGYGFVFTVTTYGNTITILRGEQILSSQFSIKIKQIGFDLNDATASNGTIKTISFKNGMCAGRSFEITDCKRSIEDDSWILTCRRSDDSEVSQRFPNSIFPISKDDQFVLININMPDLYIQTAMYKIYDRAYSDLLYYSTPQYIIEPEIDRLQIARSPQLLREGMYMPIEDDDLAFDNEVLIDSVTVTNKGTELRSFEVTLRNEKPYNRLSKIADRVGSLEDESAQNKQEASRTPAKDEFVQSDVYDISSRISKLEELIGVDEQGDVFIKPKEDESPRNLYSFGEVTAGGIGGDGPSGEAGDYYNRLDSWEDYDAEAGDVLSAVLGYDLKDQIEELQASGGGGLPVASDMNSDFSKDF